MVYLLMFVSMFIGFVFATGVFMDSNESILFNTGVLLDRQLWGMVLFVTATIAEIGFFTRSKRLIQLGGLSGFMVWLFACLALTFAGHWYILVTVGLMHMLFHGYVYLATTTGVLFR